jgi:dipeptidyl aminopeptidase/acylaminoacyl peptidase
VLRSSLGIWSVSISLGLSLGAKAQQPPGVTTGILQHPTDHAKRIEFLWTKPTGAGPWPLLVFVHGHQDGARPGAAVYATQGTLQNMAQRGIVAVAVSQPGYGRSDGPPDFAGPFTQKAITAVIEYMRDAPYVMRDRVGLYGYSRGAIAAAVVATQLSGLRMLILGAGMYDLEDGHRRLNRSVPELDGLAKNIEREAGTSRESFRDRSVLPVARRIKAATLLLHGAKDDRCPVDQAKELASQLERVGTQVTLTVFPEAGHGIPSADREGPINAFIDRWLLER